MRTILICCVLMGAAQGKNEVAPECRDDLEVRLVEVSRQLDPQQLRLKCDIHIPPDSQILGLSHRGVVTQFESEEGRTIPIADAVRNSTHKFVYRPRTAEDAGKPTTSRMTLEFGARLLRPESRKVNRIRGHFYALTANSARYVDIPFRPSEEWVRLTPDWEIQVEYATSMREHFGWDTEARRQSTKSKQIPVAFWALNQDDIPFDTRCLFRLPFREYRGPRGGTMWPRRMKWEYVRTVRYLIADDPKYHEIPFEFKNISLGAMSGEEAKLARQIRIRYIPASATRRPGRDSRLYCEVHISDPSRIIAVSRYGVLTQVNGSEHTYSYPSENRYEALSFRSSRKTIRTTRWGEPTQLRVLEELYPLRIGLALDPNETKVDDAKGYLYALVAESIEFVDVPFKPGTRTEIAPGQVFEVVEASATDDRFKCRVEKIPKGDFTRLHSEYPLPSRLAVDMELLDKDGQPCRRSPSPPRLRPGFSGIGLSGLIRDAGSPATIRYVVAVNPKHLKVPFELNGIIVD